MIELPASRWINQVRAFHGTLDAYSRGVRRLCVTSPTGSGKTAMFHDMIHWARSESKTVGIYTQRRFLFEQLAGTFEQEGIPFGRRASGHREALLRDVQICMLQSTHRQKETGERELHPADIVLVDEYHACQGDTFQAIFDEHVKAGAFLVGYTATPIDIRGIDELLVAGWPSECRAIGALVPPKTFAPDEPDLRHIRKYQVGEDLSQEDNRKAIMRPGIFGRVIKAWLKHNPDQRPTILFGPDVKGSLFFAEQFVKAGIPAGHIDGNDIWVNGEWLTSIQENRDLVREMSRTGQIKIVTNRFVLREGLDFPWIECLCLATVFGALTSFLQAGGRGLRAYPGKSKCIILDHGGNWHRGFGSLAEDRKWELGLTNHRVVGERQDNYREKKEHEPIRCGNCGKVRNGGKTCPYCGFEAHKSSRLVVQVDGTLKPVHGDVHKPRRRKLLNDTADKWTKMYHRAKGRKWSGTFKQAEAMFFYENHYWPPRNLPLMPRDSGDWYRKVAKVPSENLIPKSADRTKAPL